MNKILGTLLVMLGALQTGLPSLGLHAPVSNIVGLVVVAAIAGLAFYLGGTPAMVAKFGRFGRPSAPPSTPGY